MSQKDDATIEKVKERYGSYAKQVMASDEPLPFNADGSAPQTEKQANTLAGRLYTDSELMDLPISAINASIGCGNPLVLTNLKVGQRVLDLGSGGGIDCFMAAKAVGDNGYVIGIDATLSMIELANQSKQKMGVRNVEFRLGRIEELPVESNSIDLAISNCVIDVSPHKEAVFQEIFRVLKSGGQVAITDTVIQGELPSKLKANIDIWAGAVITPLISLTEFLHVMANAHFIDIKVQSLTSYGLESFDELDYESRMTLTKGIEWTPLPPNTGLYSASIIAEKPI